MSPDRTDGHTVRILVVDDHEMVAQSLARVINATDGFEVVGLAADVGAALDSFSDTEPDVVLMDYELPSGDGITAASEMKVRRPQAKVVMLTGHDSDKVVARAIKEGCDGFIPKTAEVHVVIDAIRKAAEGEAVFSADQLSRAVHELASTDQPDSLSDRELDVLRLMAAGVSTADIAAELYISAHTVRTHVRHILEKLGAHSKLEALSIGVRKGIVEIPTSA